MKQRMPPTMRQRTAIRQRRKETIYSLPASERWTAIIERAPTATTAESAAASLDHVLNDESLWHDPEVCRRALLRQLIQAARDYILRTKP
jgi:hypothetical protein